MMEILYIVFLYLHSQLEIWEITEFVVYSWTEVCEII